MRQLMREEDGIAVALEPGEVVLGHQRRLGGLLPQASLRRECLCVSARDCIHSGDFAEERRGGRRRLEGLGVAAVARQDRELAGFLRHKRRNGEAKQVRLHGPGFEVEVIAGRVAPAFAELAGSGCGESLGHDDFELEDRPGRRVRRANHPGLAMEGGEQPRAAGEPAEAACFLGLVIEAGARVLGDP